MSERGFLFLFSVLLALGGLGAAVWLIASGQASGVDGLFLLLSSLLVALVFALYATFVLGREMQQPVAAARKAPEAAKASAASAKPTGEPVTQA